MTTCVRCGHNVSLNPKINVCPKCCASPLWIKVTPG